MKNGAQRQNIIVLGATSAMAEAACRLWVEQGAHILLVGRNTARLEEIAADLRVRGGQAETHVADLASPEAAKSFREMADRLGAVDVVLLAYGILGDQAKAEAETQEALDIIAANFSSAAAWCLEAANVLERQGRGKLIVIGSVAGDRGRASNYVYGAAKGGLAVLVQGIAHRLANSGAAAVLIKPGFVDTPMTAHIASKGPLWAKPDAIGKTIIRAAERSSSPIVYAPGFWRVIMTVIRATPSPLFHKTKL
jgi:NAD(P)-dependent dehydrogenase (short-subunit alcohol dehydrogenase family)